MRVILYNTQSITLNVFKYTCIHSGLTEGMGLMELPAKAKINERMIPKEIRWIVHYLKLNINCFHTKLKKTHSLYIDTDTTFIYNYL